MMRRAQESADNSKASNETQSSGSAENSEALKNDREIMIAYFKFEMLLVTPPEYDKLDVTEKKLYQKYTGDELDTLLKESFASGKEWWTVVEEIGPNEFKEKLYHGSQDTYFSRTLEVVPGYYTMVNDTEIRWKRTVKRAKEDLSESLDFMRVFLIPWRWMANLVRNARRANTLFYYITLVALAPITAPVWALKKLHKHMPDFTIFDGFTISYSHLLSWALAVFSLYVLADHKSNTVYSVLCITAGIFATGAAARASDISRDASVAIAVEILIEVYSASTLVQVIITGSCVVAAMILAFFQLQDPHGVYGYMDRIPASAHHTVRCWRRRPVAPMPGFAHPAGRGPYDTPICELNRQYHPGNRKKRNDHDHIGAAGCTDAVRPTGCPAVGHPSYSTVLSLRVHRLHCIAAVGGAPRGEKASPRSVGAPL